MGIEESYRDIEEIKKQLEKIKNMNRFKKITM